MSGHEGQVTEKSESQVLILHAEFTDLDGDEAGETETNGYDYSTKTRPRQVRSSDGER